MSDRPPYEWTEEYVISNAVPENAEEEQFIKKYKEVVNSQNKSKTFDSNVYFKLKELNNTDIAKEIYARFQRKKDEENLQAYIEKIETETEELIKKFNEDREKALEKRKEFLQKQKKNYASVETFEAKHNIVNSTKEEQPTLKEKTLTPLMPKRIAMVISLLLCVIIYLVFLTTVFTTKRDTYICYTTQTGECYHSSTNCKYIINKRASETTVYEACRDYRPCQECNTWYDQEDRTTQTIRNYVYPLLISVPISVLVFLLLVYRKK